MSGEFNRPLRQHSLAVVGARFPNADGGDRRYVAIRLTEGGLKFFENTESGMERYFQDVLERIPEEKRGQVLESLALLTAAVGHGSCC